MGDLHLPSYGGARAVCTASVSRLPYWSLVRAVSQQAKIISLFSAGHGIHP